MLKVGTKRRRTKAQVKAEKEEAELREQELQARLARLAEAEAEAKLAQYDQMEQNYENAKSMILQIQAEGLVDIDDQGKISPSKQKSGIPD